MPNRWLLKTEPSGYSYDDLERDGRAVWDGVSNALALRHLRQFRKGDTVVIYHTGTVRAAIGTARVAADPYPDPLAGDPKLVVVDLVPVRRWAAPVQLDAIKARKDLAGWELVRLPRLSVLPIPDAPWDALLRMAGETRG